MRYITPIQLREVCHGRNDAYPKAINRYFRPAGCRLNAAVCQQSHYHDESSGDKDCHRLFRCWGSNEGHRLSHGNSYANRRGGSLWKDAGCYSGGYEKESRGCPSSSERDGKKWRKIIFPRRLRCNRKVQLINQDLKLDDQDGAKGARHIRPSTMTASGTASSWIFLR